MVGVAGIPISAYRALTANNNLLIDELMMRPKFLILLVGAQGLEPWTR